MRRKIRRLVRHTAGWSLLILGVAGLFLPVLQGWLFIAIASLLLAPDVPAFARLLDWIETRFPALKHPIRKARARFGHGEGTAGAPPEQDGVR